MRKAIGTISINTSKRDVPDSVAEWIFQNPKEAGNCFRLFLKNHCRLFSGEPPVLKLPSRRTFGPNGSSEFFFRGFEPDWSDWLGPIEGNGLEGEEACDSREDALVQVCFDQVTVDSWLRGEETTIRGEDVLLRMKALGHIRLGGLTLSGLWRDYLDNYHSNRGNSILEWLFRNYNVRHLNFLGLIRRSPSGVPFIPFLYRCGIDSWHPDIRGLFGAPSRHEYFASLPLATG